MASVKTDENTIYNSGNVNMKHAAGKKSRVSAYKGKRVHPKQRGRQYLLRSSRDGVRVLRSMLKGKSMAPNESESTPNPVTKKRRKRRLDKKPLIDEFSTSRKRVRYLLSRMNYEQNLIDAYSGEGWKGQSLEKIRPEKELERAKSEILRCKLKIRDLFRHLDSSLSEGRLQESLFDSEGEICSEDIFCAKCGSKELSSDNDIILCDGTCTRGFHQMCLNPPLLSKDIPPEGEGWLCPACDCRVDCIDYLNEFQGSDLSIEDRWEKVFPEAAANGDKQFDDLGFPSDDSEDGDYNPDAPEVDVENHQKGSTSEELSSGESDFSLSEDSGLGTSNCNKHDDTLGLPSDDSEDDDYDPDGPDPNEEVQNNGLRSDESDFSSDSDEFMDELNKTSDVNEASAFLLSNPEPNDNSSEGSREKNRNNSSMNSELHSSLEPDMNEEIVLLVSGKRQSERLDYKKLYDETYGEASSDSSDDDDWRGMTTPKKRKKGDIVEDSVISTKANIHSTKNHRSSRSSKGELTEVNTVIKADLSHLQISEVVNETTPKRTRQKLNSSFANHPAVGQLSNTQQPESNGNKATASAWKRLGSAASQKLLKSFKENQYPTRQAKENLAKELGITFRQVSKWFGNARHSTRAVARGANQEGFSTSDKCTGLAETCRNDTDSDKKTNGSSARNRVKGKKSGQIANSKAGAGHGMNNGDKVEAIDDKETSQAELSSPNRGSNIAKTRGNHSDFDKVVRNSTRNRAEVKNSVQAKKLKGKMKSADGERQKAVARELRKMKKSR